MTCLEEVPVAVQRTNTVGKYTHQCALFSESGYIGSVSVYQGSYQTIFRKQDYAILEILADF
jgi:hypothetical protein